MCSVIFLVAGISLTDSLGNDPVGTILLTVGNAAAIAAAAIAFYPRRSTTSVLLFGAPAAVLILGGLAQTLVIAYHVDAGTTFMASYLPELAWVQESNLHAIYPYVSIGFWYYTIVVAALLRLSPPSFRPLSRPPRHATSRISGLLLGASVTFIAASVVQYIHGFGQASLSGPELPFGADTLILLYRRDIFPLIALLAAWLYDVHRPRLSYRALLLLLAVAASEAFIATSRGALLNYGIPLVLLWIVTSRFTTIRKALLIGVLAAYLVLAPFITSLRLERVTEETGRDLPSEESASVLHQSLEQLNHFIVRVGGAGSMIWAVDARQPFSVRQAAKGLGPTGHTEYFTYEVVGVRRSADIQQGRAPTILGLGTLYGGFAGMLVVLTAVIAIMHSFWRFGPKHLLSWPVALASVSYGAVTLFSEGVPVEFYKTLLAVGLLEFCMRLAARGSSADAQTRYEAVGANDDALSCSSK